MKIKTIFTLIFSTSILLIGYAFLLIYSQNKILELAAAKKVLTDNIIKVTIEREELAYEYEDNPKDETIIQWQVMYDISKKLLQSEAFKNPDEIEILEEMRLDNVKINELFIEKIIQQKNRTTVSSNPGELPRTDKQITAEINHTGQSLIVSAFRLSEISRTESIKAIRDIFRFTIISLSLLSALFYISLIIIKIKILTPLQRINQAMRELPSGEGNVHIKTASNDEIGDMVLIFNDMAKKIKANTDREKAMLAQLQQSNQDLQEFAHTASHDLQSPLRTIMNYLQIIQKKLISYNDKEANEFIQFAIDGADKLHTIITALLSFSRIQSAELEIKPIDLNETLKDAMDNLKADIDATRAKITSDVLPSVNANKALMILLLQNLLSNAIKFHNNKSPIIHISVQDSDSEWIISIKDNGIGIDKSHLNEVFTIFKRFADSKYPGTGIGLASCKRIIERHNGKIWVESTLGEGSTFYFTIPHHTDDEIH